MRREHLPEKPCNVATRDGMDFASLLVEELRTAEELSQRLDCLEHARLRRRRVRPPEGTVQSELVRRVRKRIADGTYLSDTRLNAAIGELFATGVLSPNPQGPHLAAG